MDHISKFESAAGVRHGFNGELLVQIKYRRIKVTDRDLLIGYVAELGWGTQAKETFEIASGADSRESITGETIVGDNDPCSFDVAAPTPDS